MNETWVHLEQWIQTASIIFTVVGSTFYFRREIKNDTNAIHDRLDAETARVDAQMARIDQLYQMYVEIMKEVREGRK